MSKRKKVHREPNFSEEESEQFTQDDLFDVINGLQKTMQQDKYRIAEFEEKVRASYELEIMIKEMMASQQKKIIMLESNIGKINPETRKQIKEMNVECSTDIRKQLAVRENAVRDKKAAEFRKYCSSNIGEIELVKNKK